MYCPECGSYKVFSRFDGYYCVNCEPNYYFEEEVVELEATKENVFAVCEQVFEELGRKPKLQDIQSKFDKPHARAISVYRQEWLEENKEKLFFSAMPPTRQLVKQLESQIKNLKQVVEEKDKELAVYNQDLIDQTNKFFDTETKLEERIFQQGILIEELQNKIEDLQIDSF